MSVGAGAVWQRMSRIEKAPWVKRAAEEKKKHALMYPGYKYKPKRAVSASASASASANSTARGEKEERKRKKRL